MINFYELAMINNLCSDEFWSVQSAVCMCKSNREN